MYTYLTLSDRSTFDSDGFIAILTELGNDELAESMDFKHVSETEIITEVSMDDLIKAYNKVHGTSY